ncbi:FkbM family methyltransferase [Subtercola endophyticus]|uniref:FkbM family methyltransferase n=1 Tax=Subtercola endophyticus TaxID=2895559 RepID=UPI001E5D5EE9|nr:FkbM family methyltransferase [Subtercola endophyticus]UFS58015.1 FkbM family methyltransferase [Subtercola endophyticus]
MQHLSPRLDGFSPYLVHRMVTTIDCHDADEIPKVERAGEVYDHDGTAVQIMHNGVLVEADGYAGPWMTEVIRCLSGHHEPQEELTFSRIVTRLHETGGARAMIELGSFWSYYSLWFCAEFPDARVVAIEPDPSNLDLGRRNAALNGATDRITFIQAAIGASPGETIRLRTESDNEERDIVTVDLASLMADTGLDHVDIVLCDVQGAETIMLARARGDFAAGRVRFLVVSTHHHRISGDALTHQNALALLLEYGAHIIAEHSVSESASGDGLIAVSFDPRDDDLVVQVSHVRARDSLSGELEVELAQALNDRVAADEAAQVERNEVGRLRAVLDESQQHEAGLRAETAALSEQKAALERELNAIMHTKLWRVSRAPRAVYGRLRRRR